jgi:PAS domain S-box-containing protein
MLNSEKTSLHPALVGNVGNQLGVPVTSCNIDIPAQAVEIARLRGEVNSLCLRLSEPIPYAVPTEQTHTIHYHDRYSDRFLVSDVNCALLLADSEKRYRTLFDLSPVAVYVIDDVGIVRDFNRHAAELWGRVPVRGDTDERFCGSYKLFRPDGSLMPHDQTPMAAILSGQIDEVRDVEVVIERPDGSRITVVVNIVPVKNVDGKTTGVINCFYDVTERSHMEGKIRSQAAEMAELHRRKDEFLATLSHELRNPLAPIASAMRFLRSQSGETPVQRTAYEVIERQTGQLVRLIDELMEVSRITTGKIRITKQNIMVSEVVSRAVETIQPLVDERGHDLIISLPQEPLWLHADPDRLEQVLINLISNAAKYTNQGGRIWVTVSQRDSFIEMQVRDSGVGISNELLPHVFDLFTQADRSLDLSRGGLGIGLCLVKRLVELHDGCISATSVLGQGSEFTVSMTGISAPANVAPCATSPSTMYLGHSSRVMIVDDNKDAADILAALLQAQGFEVRVTYEGATALDAVLAYAPHVVMLDIGLPGLNGYDVARAIRAHNSLDNVVLIAATGYGSESDRLKSFEAGFNHHFVKPVSFTGLLEVIGVATNEETAMAGMNRSH